MFYVEKKVLVSMSTLATRLWNEIKQDFQLLKKNIDFVTMVILINSSCNFLHFTDFIKFHKEQILVCSWLHVFIIFKKLIIHRWSLSTCVRGVVIIMRSLQCFIKAVFSLLSSSSLFMEMNSILLYLSSIFEAFIDANT